MNTSGNHTSFVHRNCFGEPQKLSNIGNRESLPDSQFGSQLEFSPSSRKYEVAVEKELGTAVSADCGDHKALEQNVIR